MRPLVQETPIEMNEGFEKAVQPYMNELKNYCRSLTNTWDGEDLMQETLAKAYKSWVKTSKPISKAYLFRIASNTWIDGHRKRGVNEDLHRDLPEWKQEEKADSTAILDAMEVLLSKLSPKQRVVTLLIEGFGYSAGEVANLIGSNEGAVKAALHRARKNLKQVTRDEARDSIEDDDTVTYVTALQSGNPNAFVYLYQKETQEPQMSALSWGPTFGRHPVIPSIAGGGTSYMLVSIPMKNGEMLVVPFYQLELSVWLSKLEGLKEEFSIAA